MTRLSVNLNKVALLRNTRAVGYPDVMKTAKRVLAAGAHGITVHPRPDERHIKRSDIPVLSDFLKNDPAEFNIEGYPDTEFLRLVTENFCDQVTLVPDEPNQKTSDHGWDIRAHKEFLGDVIAALKAAGRRVSLFIDPVPEMAAAAAKTGADRVELYTGPYFENPSLLPDYVATARAAKECGLGINAGHDLNLDNLGHFIAAIPECDEVSIGHAITSDALDIGWDGAIKAYLSAIQKAKDAQ